MRHRSGEPCSACGKRPASYPNISEPCGPECREWELMTQEARDNRISIAAEQLGVRTNSRAALELALKWLRDEIVELSKIKIEGWGDYDELDDEESSK